VGPVLGTQGQLRVSVLTTLLPMMRRVLARPPPTGFSTSRALVIVAVMARHV
jgi:hypothetical protein